MIDAEQGKQFHWTIAVEPFGEDLQFSGIESDPSFLQLELKKKESSTNLKRDLYDLTITVPPHVAKGTWIVDDPGYIRMKTNHPMAEEYTINVALETR